MTTEPMTTAVLAAGQAGSTAGPTDPTTSTDQLLGRVRLGQLLVLLGMIGSDDAAVTGWEQEFGDERNFGEILVSSGRLTHDQLDFALAMQQQIVERQLQDAVPAPRSPEAPAPAPTALPSPAPALTPQPTGLPAAPSNATRVGYARRSRWLLPLQWVSFAGAAVSGYGFAQGAAWLWPFLVTLGFTSFYFALGQLSGIAGRGRFDVAAHDLKVAAWSPSQVPSVDVMLPSCGEPLEVLENTWRHVAALEYPGTVTVLCLDDAGRPEVEEMAARYGFRYLARPTHEMKKAGNLKYGYERSDGDLIAVFDADFAPRADFLLELVPYLDDPAVGIVQSPQHFEVRREQGWLERGAGAVQELFYRHLQAGRSALGAPICVGSNAVYRRRALDEIGGTAQIEHSEDVHTGFRLLARGYQTVYVPLVLATGLCPDRLSSFFTQQYRWCSGSMSLLCSRSFWQAKLRLRQRACFISGFVYYMHTAFWTFLAPLPAVLMVWRFPQHVALRNYLPLLPAILTTWVAFPAWHRVRYPRMAADRVRLVYGYAHMFAILDTLRGSTEEWKATGGVAGSSARFATFRRVQGGWSAALGALLAGGIALRISEGYDPVAFAPVTAFGTYLTVQSARVWWAGRATDQPTASTASTAAPAPVPAPQSSEPVPAPEPEPCVRTVLPGSARRWFTRRTRVA
ncbi:MAG TPA: glycosyltransferase family 2 protein [Mycobacteriales bacterium]|nr:glycosyltransferase family 2 protein [Mycobacteriales bacterium]